MSRVKGGACEQLEVGEGGHAAALRRGAINFKF